MAARAVASCVGAEAVEVWANAAEGPEVAALEQVAGLRVHASKENLPFAEVVNLAAERAHGASLLFLTNDAWLAPGALPSLKAALDEDAGLAAVMPLQLQAQDPGTVHHGGGTMSRRRWAPVIVAGGEPRGSVPARGVRHVEWLDGAAVLYRPGIHDELPMWPGYQFYWEDVDWGLRAARAGYRLGVVDHAEAYHETSPTTGRFVAWRHYLLARNRLVCAGRLCPPDERREIVRKIVLSSLALAVRSPHRVQQRMRLRAAADYLRGRADQPVDPQTFR